jgi:hypothetical protein
MWDKIREAVRVVEEGISDRCDLKDINTIVYRVGKVIRIDIKGK